MAPPSTVSKSLYLEVNYLSFPVETDNNGAYVYRDASMYSIQEEPNIPTITTFEKKEQEGKIGDNKSISRRESSKSSS